MSKLWITLLISILAALLVACGGAEETPTPTEEAVAVVSTDTPLPVEPSPTPEPAEPTATNTAEATETPAPTEEPTEPPPTVTPTEEVVVIEDECLACHADKDRLIETAALVEEVPSESSGVG